MEHTSTAINSSNEFTFDTYVNLHKNVLVQIIKLTCLGGQHETTHDIGVD